MALDERDLDAIGDVILDQVVMAGGSTIAGSTVVFAAHVFAALLDVGYEVTKTVHENPKTGFAMLPVNPTKYLCNNCQSLTIAPNGYCMQCKSTDLSLLTQAELIHDDR